jgi:hypothetical protein
VRRGAKTKSHRAHKEKNLAKTRRTQSLRFVIPDRSLTGSGIQGNALKPSNAVIARLLLLLLPGSTGQSQQYCQTEIPRSRLTPRRGMTTVGTADASSWNDIGVNSIKSKSLSGMNI